MENLSYLALLACPLMMIAMLFFIKKMSDGGAKAKQSQELEKNLSKLVKQNEELTKEIESMKRSRL
ncbi:DUF2933 domain-containing protein [Evansella cellulosilytica]|uniref:DUF2933 domain-containing protein n=1 Tax=Evansella cellulosilytica (strain ATCC 21833 / DSM 2522 / FERM P-1141 / JCM 9156 / N-4) TaxID=649639 RepID=E6TQV6_EVAC2|nr:DUF2933 domain-containing protein [Evansella cellulosilytica]ADU31731.1 hypothetical protein Bcell_3489 [Evansella cellulosilytica DSM 2522]